MWGEILKPLIGPIIDKALSFIPNPEERQKAALEAQKAIMEQQAEIVKAIIDANAAQIDVNKVEAASSSMFVAGWRPAIGWICGAALAWQFVIQPLASYFIGLLCAWQHVSMPALPTLDNSQLYPILMGMLGLGGLRTLEKVQGVSRGTLAEPDMARTK